MKVEIGGIYPSKFYGKFKILREIERIKFNSIGKELASIYEVEFIDTGYHSVVSSTAIKSGDVKDRMIPTVFGIGYMGQNNIWFPYGCKDQSYDRMIYDVWNNMLDRCYNPHCISYHKYGARGVRVDSSWHEFFQFEKDVKNLPNYHLKKQFPNRFELDKDFLQQGIPYDQKVYSKNTCLWISYYENLMIVGKDNGLVPYYGVTLDNGYYYIKMQIPEYNGKEIYFGRFAQIEEAANFFNYIYPLVIPPIYNTLNLINNVPDLGFEELMKRNLLLKRDNMKVYLASKGIIV